MEVIDIPSSPEPLPVVSRLTRRQDRPVSQKRRVPPLPLSQVHAEEIIEITDSDDETAPKLTPPKEKRPVHHVQELSRNSGPSLPKVPAFGTLPIHLLQPIAASARSSHGDRIPAAPLFYPDNEHPEVEEIPVGQRLENPSGPVFPSTPPPQPPEPPVSPADPTDACVARVIEIVPDVLPAHVLALVKQILHQPDNARQDVLEFVLHSLFESPDYPKVDGKRKRKRIEDDDDGDGSARGQPVPKIDYGRKDREYKGGLYYFELALEQLMVDFPYVPKPHLRMRLLENRFYAPTHFLLADEEKQDSPPYTRKLVPSRVSGKAKAKIDVEFEVERQWVLQQQDAHTFHGGERLEAANGDSGDECEDGIECGCCFSSHPFEKMVQCPEAHLFCKSCMSSYASNLLGEHNPNIICMDQSGCKLLFPLSELERFLPPKLLELYHRVKQRKDIEAAGLENLEECPFCDYKCVIENEMEKLFRCENVDCGEVSCRQCKRPDHLPKSCQEVESDKRLDVQHVVEEAMTRALMRNCPKCQKAFIKEHGCNKMTCPNCRTFSCYICRKIITGYEHFGNRAPDSGRGNQTKCQLWDPVEQHHAKEVQAAAMKAIEELKRDHPDVDPSNIKVDIPVVDPAPNSNRYHPPPVNIQWGLPAFPNIYQPMQPYGAVPAAGAWQYQLRRGVEERMLEEERRRAQLMLEHTVWRNRVMADRERARHDIFMAAPMPPLPPIPQVQQPMFQPPLIPQLPPVPHPIATQRGSRRH